MSRSFSSPPNDLTPQNPSFGLKLQPLPSNGQNPISVAADLPGSSTQRNPTSPPGRYTSQNRRARSEVTYPRKDKSNLLAQRKRPSRVTGGYETTSDENDSSPPEIPAASLIPDPTQRRVHGLGSRSSSGRGRTRAQTLMSPTSNEQAPNGDVSGMSELGVDRKRKFHRRPGESASQRNSRDPLRLPSAATSIPPSHLNIQRSAQPGYNLPTARSDSFFPHTALTGPSRTASSRFRPESSRTASMILDSEERADGTSSIHSRKGKGKDTEPQVGGLATSLGLIGVRTDIALSSRTNTSNLLFTS